MLAAGEFGEGGAAGVAGLKGGIEVVEVVVRAFVRVSAHSLVDASNTG